MMQKRAKVNLSIKRRMQVRLMLKVMLILLTGTAVTSIVFYFYANQEVGATFKQFHIQARTFLDYLLPAVVLSGVVGLFIGGAISLFLPHAFAGPLYRIEKDLEEQIARGNLGFRFSLRRRDEFKELEESLNETLEKVSEKFSGIKEASNELASLVANGAGDCEGLEAAQKKLARAVDSFRLTPS